MHRYTVRVTEHFYITPLIDQSVPHQWICVCIVCWTCWIINFIMTVFLIQSITFFWIWFFHQEETTQGLSYRQITYEGKEKDKFTERRREVEQRTVYSIMPTDRSFVVKGGSRIVQKNPFEISWSVNTNDKQLHPTKYIWLFVIYSFIYTLSYIKSNKTAHDITPLVAVVLPGFVRLACWLIVWSKSLRHFSDGKVKYGSGITGTTE